MLVWGDFNFHVPAPRTPHEQAVAAAVRQLHDLAHTVSVPIDGDTRVRAGQGSQLGVVLEPTAEAWSWEVRKEWLPELSGHAAHQLVISSMPRTARSACTLKP